MEELLDAISKGHTDEAIARIEALRADGADLNTADQRGRTPAYLAGRQGDARVIAALRAGGADLNAVDEAGGGARSHGGLWRPFSIDRGSARGRRESECG
jgi:ankyrin repeat protein